MASTKAKILILVDWYFPAFKAGGPIQSVRSLVGELKNQFDIYIFTGNTELDGSILPVEKNVWLRSEDGCFIYYADKNHNNYGDLKRIIGSENFKCVYLNGMYSLKYSILPLFILKRKDKLKQTILAPRGMLGAGALSIKPFKKKVFLFILKRLAFFKAITWHSTSAQESEDILREISVSAKIFVIPNLPRSIVRLSENFSREALQLFFFSRISEKKNLLFALRVLQKITVCKIEYHIFGPIEDNDYWHQCESLISKMPSNISVKYHGAIQPVDVPNQLSKMQVLFLPTLNENYGHSIVESLLCGCPVIISDQTPWLDLKEAGAGFSIALSHEQEFADAIRFYCKLTSTEFEAFSIKATKYIHSKIDKETIVNKYIQLFDGKQN